MKDIRTEGVGSMLRTPELLAARAKHEAGELSPSELKRIEDAAVDETVAIQEQVGLDVVTDGEMGKTGFSNYLMERFSGFAPGVSRPQWKDLLEYPGVAARRAALSPSQLPTPHYECAGDIAVTDPNAIGRDIADLQAVIALIAFLLLRLAQQTQTAISSALAFARLVRANLMHARTLQALLDPEPPRTINPDQLSLALRKS